MPPWASWQLRKSGKSAPPPSSWQEEVARVWGGHLAKANFFSVFFWAFFSKMWMQKGVSKNYSSVTVKRHLLELLIDQEVNTEFKHPVHYSDGEEVGPLVDPNLSRRNFFLYLFTGINRPRHPRRPRNMVGEVFFWGFNWDWRGLNASSKALPISDW